jgi:hypothetical protein
VTLLDFWSSYLDAYALHNDVQCKTNDLCMLPETRDGIIEDTLHDAVGFIGWWLFSLVASCPVDVMPIPAASMRSGDSRLPLCFCFFFAGMLMMNFGYIV